MFESLKNTVILNQEGNDKEFKAQMDKHKALLERLEDDEAQIELLKKMGAPKGGDGGAGVLEVLNDMIDKLRNAFTDKLNDLSGRIDKLKADTTAEDAREQGEIDSLKKLIASYD
jgi:hypothetical protein